MTRFFLLSLILLQCSCNTSRELLSPAEEGFMKELSDECGCEAALQPDEYALQNNSSTGTFSVTFINSSVYYCESDSTELARISANITKRLALIMSNKQNYSNVRFRFIQTSREEITCTRDITIRRP